MAAKLTITSTFSWTDGKDNMSAKGSQTIIPVGQTAAEIIQTIPTDITSVNLGGQTPKYVFFENKDITNPVTIASDNAMAHVVAVVAPGEAYALASSVSAYWAQATGNPVNLLVQVVPA